MENLDSYREHQEWREKTYGSSGIGSWQPKHQVWIQYDPTTGVCARLPVTFGDSVLDEDLSQLRPGWRYFRIFTPTKEWEIDAYLDSPAEHKVELNMEEYKSRFV